MGAVVWIEGIIGAGKTTLTKKVAKALNLRAIYEPVETNFLLEDFYRDPKTFAFPMQIHLLMSRFNLQSLAVHEAIGQLGYRGAVLDRGLPGDRVFAKLQIRYGNIDPKLWDVYDNAFNIMSSWLRPPSLLVYLEVEPKTALKRIRSRGREAEKGITLEYLEDLRNGYEELLEEIESCRHAWSRGMSIYRVAWDEDFKDEGPLITEIKERCHI